MGARKLGPWSLIVPRCAARLLDPPPAACHRVVLASRDSPASAGSAHCAVEARSPQGPRDHRLGTSATRRAAPPRSTDPELPPSAPPVSPHGLGRRSRCGRALSAKSRAAAEDSWLDQRRHTVDGWHRRRISRALDSTSIDRRSRRCIDRQRSFGLTVHAVASQHSMNANGARYAHACATPAKTPVYCPSASVGLRCVHVVWPSILNNARIDPAPHTRRSHLVAVPRCIARRARRLARSATVATIR